MQVSFSLLCLGVVSCLAALSSARVVPSTCWTNTSDGNVTLQYFPVMNNTVSINGAKVPFFYSLCTPTTFAIDNVTCGAGYMMRAVVDQVTGALSCGETYDSVPSSVVYDVANKTATISYFSEAQTEVVVRIKCVAGLEGLNPMPSAYNQALNIYTLNLDSEEICPGYTPNEPSNKLKTGAIIGIVIGIVAVVVLGAVVFQMRTKGSGQEPSYEKI